MARLEQPQASLALSRTMINWTRFVVAHRRRVLATWIILLVLGGWATSGLGKLLTNRFSVPGSDAERGLNILRSRFHERSDGAFTLVVQSNGQTVNFATAESAAQRAAGQITGGKAGPPRLAAPNVAYIQIATPLQAADAKNYTSRMRAAIGALPGARTYLTGFPALSHDLQPLYANDLTKGEAIAVPIALIVLLFMFGTLGAVVVPFAFAFVTLPTTLGLVWVIAHLGNMAEYVTNIVTLIGLAIAIDYSMLVVFRYREQLNAGDSPQEALETTMATAGRATLFSGLTVAIGLALLLLMPLPFMRSMGAGAVLIPLISIAASATFLPALLSLLGARVNRLRVVPRRLLERRASGAPGMWSRLAHSIMRHPVVYLLGASSVLIALAIPALQLHLTGGDNRGTPRGTEASNGLYLLESTIGPGPLAPHQVVIETGTPGGANAAATTAAEVRLIGELRQDPRIAPATIQAPVLSSPAVARQADLLDGSAQALQIRAAGRTDAGTAQAKELVHAIRERYIPAAGFPHSDLVLLAGAPAFGVDFVNKAYGAFPWLVAAVLVITYFVLLRAFRSLFLPLKAVLLNLLSVSAAYGVLVLVFQHGIATSLGFHSSPQIEAWIPIFLFAVIFGISMDYEVFLLSRVREEWDRTHDNQHAVAYGLEHTGRIITAAAIIMIAAFSGFMTGRFVGLQEFGLGLSAAIFLDATIVRALLVPSVMKLLGDWNWYLPEGMRKAMRLRARPELARRSDGSARLPAS
ncbi:MAG TPA: MMPL family transporter [Solirubrobacteraceae bacterium]|jgi:RND superfamily putative drug exporter|nr:MMPL family transporter [Solirubrobacteraceae bacterium]